MAEKDLVYFKVEDAMCLDVAKAVLLGNLRYWLDENKKTEPGYCMHAMSPTELARVLPFSKATIQRKLHDLVNKDMELVSLLDVDGREPAKYGFAGKVAFKHHYDISRPQNSQNPSKTAPQSPRNQIWTMGASIPNPSASNPNTPGSEPNAEGSNPNDYTTLEKPLENHLKEPVEKSLLERTEPLLRRGSVSDLRSLPTLKLTDSSRQVRSLNQSCGAIDDLPAKPILTNAFSVGSVKASSVPVPPSSH